MLNVIAKTMCSLKGPSSHFCPCALPVESCSSSFYFYCFPQTLLNSPATLELEHLMACCLASLQVETVYRINSRST